jgi:sulfotransferase family protein
MNRYASQHQMTTDDFRILIAATEKTGNTWLKYLLAHIYDLPTPYISENFSESEADSLGNRWVTHQHFLAERPLLTWAARRQIHLLTMIRHPADILVSLYHYCCNYPDHYKGDVAVAAALAADTDERQATAHLPHHVVDGELLRLLQERIMCDVNISISWIRSGRSRVVRYEDLKVEPLQTLSTVAESIAPISRDRVEKAIECCDIKVLRDNYAIDSRFFRRALIGEWRSVLPTHILHRFAKEEPFRSQFAFLGYKVEIDKERGTPRAREARSIASPRAEEHFDNGARFVPVLGRLLASVPPETRARWGHVLDTSSRDCFFHWANASADDDPLAEKAIPLLTNLAVFVHKFRPDLQAEFPDPFDRNRLGYAAWFLRYAGYEHRLDRCFLTPIALSWINQPVGSDISRPQQVVPT